MSADEFMKLLNAPEEDLDPELQSWLDEDGVLGTSIKHPLVFSVIHTPRLNSHVNAQLRAKKKAVREAQAAEDWRLYIFLHERPYRPSAFASISWRLGPEEYWTLLGTIYSDTENQWQEVEFWRDALTDGREGREYMSSPDARCVFTLPPERGGLLPHTRIYRGYRAGTGLQGFSWTLSKATARWFAHRMQMPGDPAALIASGYVAKENVIAYLTDRGEQEIVCLPEHVEHLHVEDCGNPSADVQVLNTPPEGEK